MNLKRIRLELARTPDFPEGSAERGYEFVAPLTKDNHIDAEAWTHAKDHCRVVRFWGDAPKQTGRLRHVGSGWRFDYIPKEDSDDEPLFKLDRHTLTVGSYLSITEHDGVQRPFKIVSIIPVDL
jgi:hypothetical protein